MKKVFILPVALGLFFMFNGTAHAQNSPDNSVNLALLGDATVTSSIPSGTGRGTPGEILYDPVQDNYATVTQYNEHGVTYAENMGAPAQGSGFNWEVEWTSPKYINYITFGGTYPNQPQPNAKWVVSYFDNGVKTTLEAGTGGWIDSGTYEWDHREQTPIYTSKILLEIFSDGTNDLVSIHIRARGGVSTYNDDSAATPKACLIQYLPSNNAVAVTGVSLNTSSLNISVGNSQNLVATITPSNATNQNVIWSSADTSIASVNSNGIVTANSEGSTTVTVTTADGSYTESATVTVSNNSPPPTGNSVWSEANSVASYTGDVGVGTVVVPSGYKMAIDGKLITEEVKVQLSGNWPDYVFKKDYRLHTLEEIQKHIEEKGHLPNIPSAEEVKANGIELGEMNRLLLEKIEELTLYILNQERRIKKLENLLKNDK